MTAAAALWFLPAVIPLAFLITWNDMRSMKIKNGAVMAFLVIYAILGPFAFGWPLYAWQWLHVPVVLVVCMALWALRVMGAGDAKLIAAMSPFFVVETIGDVYLIGYLFISCSLAALITHRVFRATSLTSLTPDWKSWTDARVPKGFALSMILVFYLGLAAFYG